MDKNGKNPDFCLPEYLIFFFLMRLKRSHFRRAVLCLLPHAFWHLLEIARTPLLLEIARTPLSLSHFASRTLQLGESKRLANFGKLGGGGGRPTMIMLMVRVVRRYNLCIKPQYQIIMLPPSTHYYRAFQMQLVVAATRVAHRMSVWSAHTVGSLPRLKVLIVGIHAQRCRGISRT
eukprot:6214726-Pleurochrysis_carterae.AAC.2